MVVFYADFDLKAVFDQIDANLRKATESKKIHSEIVYRT